MQECPTIGQNGLYCLQLFSLSYIENVALDVLKKMPKTLMKKLESIKVEVENFADVETLKALKINEKYDLLGIYRGIPYFQKTMNQERLQKDSLILFRAPLIRYTQEFNESIDKVIAQVIVHEITHHFMISKEEMKFALRDL